MIGRADLSWFMLARLTDRTHFMQAPFVASE